MALETLLKIGKTVTALDLNHDPGCWINKSFRFMLKVGGAGFAFLAAAGGYFVLNGSWAEASPEKMAEIYRGIQNAAIYSAFCYMGDWVLKVAADFVEIEHGRRAVAQQMHVSAQQMQEQASRLESMTGGYAQPNETRIYGLFQRNRDRSIN